MARIKLKMLLCNFISLKQPGQLLWVAKSPRQEEWLSAHSHS